MKMVLHGKEILVIIESMELEFKLHQTDKVVQFSIIGIGR